MPEEKQAKKPSKSAKPHTLYELKGESLARKNKTCPKCGAGVYLAKHGNRVSCGRCSYTEFSKKEKQ